MPEEEGALDAIFDFKQIPDLTLSVWILEKYFIEITYRGEEEKENLFLIGYEGEEDELLRHLSIGNTDINLSPYLKLIAPMMLQMVFRTASGWWKQVLSGNELIPNSH